ncbi:MAG: hypothetical protein J2P15_09570 [Micromonosporaceae bacterium]|nr:hypothetical protein [Micromonosporaceae bacterium]
MSIAARFFALSFVDVSNDAIALDVSAVAALAISLVRRLGKAIPGHGPASR